MHHATGFFKYIKWAVKDFSDAPLQTNDQLFSLTDQLNLGVRSLELDTHWVRALMVCLICSSFQFYALGLQMPSLA